MHKILIDPEKLQPFGYDDADAFYLVTNQRWLNQFSIINVNKYKHFQIIAYDSDLAFREMLKSNAIKPSSHLLIILPDCQFVSIPESIVGQRKLLFMACKSGETDIDGIKHFLQCGYNTNPEELQHMADHIFEKGEASKAFTIKDTSVTSAQAVFDHMKDYYDWHEQLGYLEWGNQQIFPAGEIACFIVPLKTENLPNRNFELDGNVIFTGPVIVQSGSPSFRREDQLRIYEKLNSVHVGLNLFIKQGVVTEVEPLAEEDTEAAHMFNALIGIDSRYSHIYEIGFSLNKNVAIFPGNTAMNEVWGEGGGNIHLGLGMLPYTQYHIDMFCKNAYVVNEKADLIFGRNKISPQKSAACPCIMA